jgi:hypothetical protein
MKKNFLFSVTLFLLLCISTMAQIRNYTLFPSRVNVTATTIVNPAAALPGFSASEYAVGNGAYQEGGSNVPIFTVKDFGIFNAAGTQVATLPHYTQTNYCEPEYPNCQRTFSFLNKEIAIVPIPGTCRKFYVIYSLHELFATVTMVARVNADNLSSIFLESSNLLNSTNPYIPSQSGALAVSKKKTNGNFDLYVLWYDRIKKFEIAGSGITFTADIGAGVIPTSQKSNELELSNDGVWLAWGNHSTLYRITTSGVFFSSKTLSSSIHGIEFNSSNSSIIFASIGTINIQMITYTASTTSVVSNIALPAGWSCYSHLEQDGMNRIFGVAYISSVPKLFHFNQNNTASPAINTQINVYSYASSGAYYEISLNDQIDGENYTNFVPTVPLTTYSFINGTSNNVGNWNPFYNCTPITLALLTSGSTARFILTKLDVNKNVVTGPSAYSYTSAWVSPSTFNTDLRFLAGTSNHLNSNNGYYGLTIQTKNDCNATNSAVWYLQINASPTPASISVKLNDSDPITAPGIPVSTSHTAPGIAMNTWSGSYNLNNSTGDISYRSIKVEEVTNTGVFIRDIINPAYQEAVSGVASLTALPLNSANVPAIPALGWTGGQGFFANQGLNKFYKITFTVGNVCGSSSDFSFVKLDASWARLANNLNTSGADALVYPNPFQDQITIKSPFEDAAQLSIINSLGETIFESEIHESLEIDGSSFSPGIYLYTISSHGDGVNGKLVK